MAQPTAYEQYMLELVNRARQNPIAEATLYNIDLNEGLAPQTISDAAKQPLAFNFHLIDAARSHSQWMLDNDTFSHTGINGSDAGERIVAADYQLTGNWAWGENLAVRWTVGTPDLVHFINLEHEGLFRSSGHRENLMNGFFREIGIGVLNGDYQGWNAVMATHNFATSGSSIFLTGVAFQDGVVDDDFYSVGEGLGGITVEATRLWDQQTFTTTTFDSGGYQLALNPGTYSVTFSGAQLSQNTTQTVTIGTENVKLDLQLDTPAIQQISSIPVVLPDLSGAYFNVLREPLSAGDSFEVNFAVQNIAAESADNFVVNFYLSTDSDITTSDYHLGTYSFTGLAANSTTNTISTQLSLPAAGDGIWQGVGDYYIGMVVDGNNQVSEANEANNSSQREFQDYDSVAIVANTNTQVLAAFSGTPDRDTSLQGSSGDDDITGLSGSDYLIGGAGDDTLIGVDPNSVNPGRREIDRLRGDEGADTFILGDRNQVYYNDGNDRRLGRKDYAIIEDFNSQQDVIQLHGSADDYVLRRLGTGTAILYNTTDNYEGIGFVAGTEELQLTAAYFDFVV